MPSLREMLECAGFMTALAVLVLFLTHLEVVPV